MKLELEEQDIERIAERVARKILGAQQAGPRKPYTITEAAALAGVTAKTLRKAVAAGKIPRVPGTERHLIPAAAFDAYLEGRAV